MSSGVDVDPDENVVRAYRRLRESGDSIVITIPPEIVKMTNLTVGEDVEIVADMETGEVTLRPAGDPDD